jgi:Leucine-rich repeat (LRR) protein
VPHLVSLNLSDNSLVSLAGLEKLFKLKHLQLARNELETLAPLAALTSLVTLDVSGNSIADLSPLRGMRSLAVLVASHNCVGSGAASWWAAGGGGALRRIDLCHNAITDLAPLGIAGRTKKSRMPALETLIVAGNPLALVLPRDVLGAPTIREIDACDTAVRVSGESWDERR